MVARPDGSKLLIVALVDSGCSRSAIDETFVKENNLLTVMVWILVTYTGLLNGFLSPTLLHGLRNQISSSAHSGVVRGHIEFLRFWFLH